jgi:hypothetical protein
MAFDPMFTGPGGFHMAPEATNPLRGLRLRLCALKFGVPAEPKAEKEHVPSRVDAIFDALTVELLKEAFVILIPAVQDSTSKPILARTTVTGQLVWIAEKDLGGAPPASPANDVFLEAGKTYYYFWTRHGQLCRKLWKLVKENAASTIADNPFYLLQTEEQGPPADFHGLGLKEQHYAKMGLLFPPTDGAKQPQTTGRSVPLPSKLLRGEKISKLSPQGGAIEATASYAIARTDSVAVLFLADVITALANDILVKTAEDRAALESVRDIVKKVTEDEVVEQLQEELVRGDYFGHYFCRGDWHKAYYPYAHRCAKKKVPRKLFAEAVDASNDSSAWQEAALQIASEFSIPHPDYPKAQDTPDKRLARNNFWRVQVEPVLKIYDCYTFGFEHVGAAWYTRLDGVRNASERKLRALKQLTSDLMSRRASYKRLLQELDAHFAEDFEQRRETHTRYLELAVASEYRWWDEFDKGFFAGIKPYTDWLSTNTSKMNDLLTAYFGEPGRVVEFNNFLKENVGEFERMFKKLDEFDSHFGGKKVKRSFVDGTKFEVDFKNNKLRITTPKEEIEEIGPLYFVMKTTNEQTLVRQEKQILRKGRVRIRKVETKTRTTMAIVPEVPFKKIHTVPLWLGAFGDTLALVVTMSQLGNDLSKAEGTTEKIDVLGKTAGGVFSAIGSVSDAINYTFVCTTKIPWLLRVANPISKGVELVYNFKEGYRLLTFGEESEIVAALERGDGWDAVLLTTKGVVLWCSIVPGTAAIFATLMGVAVTTGGIMPPLAIGLAFGAIVISGIDFIRYLRNGPENAMEPVAEKLKKAIKGELGDYAYSRTVNLLNSLCDHSKKLVAVSGS